MFFFFSSRRRHTRCSRDWSSDVCSSDLKIKVLHAIGPNVGLGTRIGAVAEVGALSEYRSVKPLSQPLIERTDRKSTRLNSSHGYISYAVFCLKKKKVDPIPTLLSTLVTG